MLPVIILLASDGDCFQVGSSVKAASNATTTATPEPVATEKCDEKTMWATGAVNVRENGSTSYAKVGALKTGDAVTVTGIDSTGWYEIRLSDGTVCHVSNNYLTDVEPATEEAESTEETEAVEAEEAEATTETGESSSLASNPIFLACGMIVAIACIEVAHSIERVIRPFISFPLLYDIARD